MFVGRLPRWTYYFILGDLGGSGEMTPGWYQLLIAGARRMGPWHFPTSFSGRQLPGVVPAQPFRCLGRGTCGHEQDNSFSDWPRWHGFKNEPKSILHGQGHCLQRETNTNLWSSFSTCWIDLHKSEHCSVSLATRMLFFILYLAWSKFSCDIRVQ